MKRKKTNNCRIRLKSIKMLGICIFMLFFIALSNREIIAAKFGDFYESKNGNITRILPETTLQDLKNNLENQNIQVIKENGSILANNGLVGTGMKFKVGKTAYKISVVGDVDGNGKISVTDSSKINAHVNKLKTLDEKYLFAADLNNDGKVSITDAVQINQVVVGIKDIEAPLSFTPTVTTSGNTITIEGTTSDKLSGVSEYSFRLDNENWVQNTSKTNGKYTFTGLNNEKHNVIMKVKDVAGNEKKTIIKEITVRNQTPTPSPSPSPVPSVSPTPVVTPSTVPSTMPSISPTPVVTPSTVPSQSPVPSVSPSPAITPSVIPSTSPTPAVTPSAVPSIVPSTSPSTEPSTQPSNIPSVSPSPEQTEYTVTYEYNNATEGNTQRDKTVTYGELYGDLALPKRKYTIRYNTNGETNIEDVEVEYTFGGWYKEIAFANLVTKDSTVTDKKDHTLYAKWEERNIRLPEITREGYTFEGWYENSEFTGTKYDIGQMYTEMLTGNKEFYAKWVANGYILNFEYNGATSKNTEITRKMQHGAKYGVLPQPEIEYKVTYKSNDGTDDREEIVAPSFLGWYKEATFDTLVDENTVFDVNEDVTIYAKWGESKTTIKDINPKEGHTFEGWYENSVFQGEKHDVGDILTIDKDITLYAKWKGIDFTVTYEYDGATAGNTASGKNVTYLEEYGELPSVERGLKKEYVVTLVKNDGTENETRTVEYTFGGWYLDEERITMIREDAAVTTNGDHTIYANWYGDKVTLPYFEREGYTFSGWYENSSFTGTAHNPGEKYEPIGDKTFYLKWTQNTLTIEYETNGGNTIANTIAKYGDEITLPTPIKNGYELEGWYRDEELTDKITEEKYTAMDNTTLYAKWNLKEYTISYELNDGEVEGENPTTYNVNTETITLIQPTKEEYVFKGWTGSNGSTPEIEVTIPKGSTGDKTYTANWENNKSTLIIDPNGGEIEVTINGVKTTITEPTEYKQEANTTLKYNALTKDITKINENYTVFFDAKGGTLTSGSEEEEAQITKVTNYQFTNWTKSNNFKGNMSSDTATGTYTFSDNTEVINRLTANYTTMERSATVSSITAPTASKTITITFDYNCNDLENETQNITLTMNGWYIDDTTRRATNGGTYTPTRSENLYAKWSSSTLNKTPTRNGYVFAGWYSNKEYTEFVALGRSMVLTDSITLYAKWIETEISTDFESYGYYGVHMGDYINYNAASSTEEYSYTTNQTLTGEKSDIVDREFKSTDTMLWRVLGVETSTGQLMIISADGTPNALKLYGSTGLLNGEKILNDISGVYGHGNGADRSRSATIYDIESFSSYVQTKTYGKIYYVKFHKPIVDNNQRIIGLENTFSTAGRHRWNTDSNMGYDLSDIKVMYSYSNANEKFSEEAADTLLRNSSGEYRNYWLSNYSINTSLTSTTTKISKDQYRYNYRFYYYEYLRTINDNTVGGTYLYSGRTNFTVTTGSKYTTTDPKSSEIYSSEYSGELVVCPVIYLSKNITLNRTNTNSPWNIVL